MSFRTRTEGLGEYKKSVQIYEILIKIIKY